MISGTHTQLARRLLLALVTVFLSLAMAQSSLAELRQATEQDPGNVEAWIALGNGYFEANDFENAKESFLEAISLSYVASDAHYGLGLAEYGRGDFQAALFAFTEATRLAPDRFDGHFNQAVTLAKLRRPAEAATAFQKAINEAEPEATAEDLVSAYLGLATQRNESGDFRGEAAAYQGALELQPESDEVAFLWAGALQRSGAGRDALPILTELLSRGYRASDVSTLIADVYLGEGQIDLALRSLERGLASALTDGNSAAQANILVKLGLLQRSLGREAEAGNSFLRATQADPQAWEAFYNLGAGYLDSGQTRSAVDALESARGINGDNGDIHLALASAYDQLARYDEALGSAAAALDLLTAPELVVQAHFILGRAMYRQGDYEGAAAELEEVVQTQPDNAQAQLWAGLAEYQLGNFRTSSLYYERAVQIDPSSVEARVNLGAAYLASERYRDAELVYQLLVQQNPSDTESFYNLGWSLISQERRGAARDAWGAACDLGFGPACDALVEYF